jgi:hypothetical protein
VRSGATDQTENSATVQVGKTLIGGRRSATESRAALDEPWVRASRSSAQGPTADVRHRHQGIFPQKGSRSRTITTAGQHQDAGAFATITEALHRHKAVSREHGDELHPLPSGWGRDRPAGDRYGQPGIVDRLPAAQAGCDDQRRVENGHPKDEIGMNQVNCWGARLTGRVGDPKGASKKPGLAHQIPGKAWQA